MAKRKTTIKWYGDDMINAIAGATDQGLLDGARELISLAKPNVPTMTGTLRDSGYAANYNSSDYTAKKGVHKREIRPSKGIAVAAFAAFYAKFVEMGTRNLPARSFLRSSIDSYERRIAGRIVNGMKDDLT